ncbi:hypothetical protein [Hyalangium sp.]|uniref:hypothetical protein n=1 Tax=Hyalangium sp. TaxID=2028555 RepID=UPI002D404A1E|nr:hypothetical protein [Hyalangium sp.]HYI00979.1 hypothetical protein [Hyalangium sp.]
MPLLCRSRLWLAVMLVLAGCKSEPRESSATDTGTAAAPAPRKEPTATPAPSKEPTPTPAPAAISGTALSYLKPVDAQHCQWVRQPLPSGALTDYTFDAPCDESLLSWSPDGTQGLVFSFAVGDGAQPRTWLVDFAGKSGKPMDLKGLPGGTGGAGPDKASIHMVGFDAQGRPVALVFVHRALEKGEGGERFITFEGQRYPVKGGEGLPGLALAYRLEGTEWKRFEAKASFFEPESSPGVDVLEAAKALPVQTFSLFGDPPGQEASEGAAQRLEAALPGQEPSGKWMSLSTPGGTLHYRGRRDPEEGTFFPSAPVRWEQEGKLVELEGLTAKEGDRLGFQARGGLLLVVALAGETKSAHVFDTRMNKKLVSVKDIESASFSPEPSGP